MPRRAQRTGNMFEELTPMALCNERERGELWQIVDVREDWEVEIVRLDEALHIPLNEIPDRLEELDRDTPVAVLCHSGGRSARVAGYLVEQGFTRVANVLGGIDAWSREVDTGLGRY